MAWHSTRCFCSDDSGMHSQLLLLLLLLSTHIFSDGVLGADLASVHGLGFQAFMMFSVPWDLGDTCLYVSERASEREVDI